MRRSVFLLGALLGFCSVHLAQAKEASMCTSMCASEKRQCTSRAEKRTGLDNPTFEETNPLARVANQGQVPSMPAQAAERSDFLKRKQERLGACDASHVRCTRACTPSAASAGEQDSVAK